MDNLMICLWCALVIASVDSCRFGSGRLGRTRHDFCLLFNAAEKGVKVICACHLCVILLEWELLGCISSTMLRTLLFIAIVNFSVGNDSASWWSGGGRLCVSILTVRLEWYFWLKATSFVIIFLNLIKGMLFRVVEADAVIIMPMLIADKLCVFIVVSRFIALAIKATAISIIA